jgi:hypothetical protein
VSTLDSEVKRNAFQELASKTISVLEEAEDKAGPFKGELPSHHAQFLTELRDIFSRAIPPASLEEMRDEAQGKVNLFLEQVPQPKRLNRAFVSL